MAHRNNGPKEEIEGKAVPIFSLGKRKGNTNTMDIVFDEKTLEKILMQKSVRDKKVVVLSVAGRYRQGKSFLLNLIIRFLSLFNKQDKWFDDNLQIKGFPWKEGITRDTTGIWMWNKPFFINTEEGEVAVFLMDTQGAFDGQSTHTECTVFFALSTMLSSVQIYNIKGEIGEDNLDHLEYFTQYGKHFQSNTQCGNGKPFQHLVFLIRDWSHATDHPFGETGGRDFLNKILQIKDSLSENQNMLRRDLRLNFEELTCFLMPNPGRCVRERTVHKMSEMRRDFGEKVLEFCRTIFSQLNEKCKVINGQELNCQKLCDYFKKYAEMCKDGKMPSVDSWFQSNMKQVNEEAIKTAKEKYKEQMEKKCHESIKWSDEEMESFHKDSSGKALTCFERASKLGDKETVDRFKEKLEKEIEIEFKSYKKSNSAKYSLRLVFNEMQKFILENKVTAVGAVCTALSAYIAPYIFVVSVVGFSVAGIMTWINSRTVRQTENFSNVGYRGMLLGFVTFFSLVIYFLYGKFVLLIIICLLVLLAKNLSLLPNFFS